ncbi:hypothetical protein A2U01_0110834, partial [Trifolium medium]|nr:hypothetical protein [Trifolium medium]
MLLRRKHVGGAGRRKLRVLDQYPKLTDT